MDIQPGTYYRGLYGRERAVMLYPPLSADVSQISRARTREANMFIASREIMRRIDAGGARA